MKTKKLFVRALATALSLVMFVVGFTLSTSATETLYADGTYYCIENFYVVDTQSKTNVGYVEALFLTETVVDGVNCLQLGSEVKGGSTSEYVTTSTTRIRCSVYTSKGGEVNCSSETEGSRLLSAEVKFTSSNLYVNNGIIGRVLAECKSKTTSAEGYENWSRRWNGVAWESCN